MDQDILIEPSRKRRGCLLLLLIPLIILAAAVILFPGRPHRWQVPMKISRQEAAQVQAVIQKLTSSMVTQDGKMAETAEIELTSAEINALLTQGLRAAQLRQTPGLYYDAEWKNGGLQVRISRVLWFFAINLETEAVPKISGGTPELEVLSCWIGRLPLSRKLVNHAFRQVIREYENRREFRVLLEIVESLTVQGNSIRLRIRPGKINLIFPLLFNLASGSR